MKEIVERRVFSSEIRRQDGQESRVVEGYGALYGVRSSGLGFSEVIDIGAFDSADMSDVRMLWNHNSDLILSRTKNGTLLVRSDDKGLYYSGDIIDNTFGRDALASIARGDVDQSSFGFTVETDDWSYEKDGTLFRRIIKVRSVVDVSPTAFPAYPQTHIDARKQAEIRSILDKPKNDMARIDAMIKVHRILYS